MEQNMQTTKHRGDAGGAAAYIVPAQKSYALSGEIMLAAIVILFAAVVLVLAFHIYARCYLLPRRRRRMYVEQNGFGGPILRRGLDASVLSSLPVFVFSSKAQPEPLECVVCLSEFEEGEAGRLLPRCNHRFHTECIDMWFQSHSACPLCRAEVQAEKPGRSPPVLEIPGPRIAVVIGDDSETGVSRLDDQIRPSPRPSQFHPASNSSSPPPTCSSSRISSSSSSFKAKAGGLVRSGIELPPRRISEDADLPVLSPGFHGLKSPGSRIRSLRRLLSRDRKSPMETDLERGETWTVNPS